MELRSSNEEVERRRIPPIWGLGRWKDTTLKGVRRHGCLPKGVSLLLKGNSPYVRPQAPQAESSPTRSKALPCDSGAGSRMSCKPAQGRRSQTAARGAHDRPAVTSDPPFSPRPTGRRGGQPCRRHATAPDGRASPSSDTPAWNPGPRVEQPARQLLHASNRTAVFCLCHHRASSVAEPMPLLEATQQRQPGASVKATESGPAVIAVAGGRAQRSRRQPGSRPILRQQESLLSRREDGAPVTRSSNGSHARNGRPANHSPRRINPAAGHAAPLVGGARDASPSPQ